MMPTAAADPSLDDDETRLASALEDLQDHLLAAPHEVWYDVLRRCDWDLHEDLILWMLNQPECDFATAFAAFHLARPCQFVHLGLSRDDIVAPDRCIWAVVLDRFAAGHYAAAPFGPDPAHVGFAVARFRNVWAARDPVTCSLDVPERLQSMPDLAPPVLDRPWSPEFDAESHRIYAAAGLQVPAAPRPRRPRPPKSRRFTPIPQVVAPPPAPDRIDLSIPPAPPRRRGLVAGLLASLRRPRGTA